LETENFERAEEVADALEELNAKREEIGVKGKQVLQMRLDLIERRAELCKSKEAYHRSLLNQIIELQVCMNSACLWID
jgi:hypothetical protein